VFVVVPPLVVRGNKCPIVKFAICMHRWLRFAAQIGSYNPEYTLRLHALRLHDVGMDQDRSAQAHRPRHRLAVSGPTAKELKV